LTNLKKYARIKVDSKITMENTKEEAARRIREALGQQKPNTEPKQEPKKE
jgi:hypothetical protein